MRETGGFAGTGSWSRGELPVLSHLAASAFAPMDLWHWIIPDDDARAALPPVLLRRPLADVHARDGMLLVAEAEGRPLGVAAWAAPGQAVAQRRRSLLAAPALLRAAWPHRAALRVLGERGPRVDQALEARHPAEPHWYLGLLTVAPDAQVGGVGSALVRAGLARADADGLPTYLECERHLEAYYARFGFARTHTVEIDDGVQAHLGMWRPAGG